MAIDPSPKPSFSPRSKWGIGINVTLIVVVLLSVVIMVNYLSQTHFVRVYTSTRTPVRLSPQTLALVRSLTNQVRIVLYFNKEDQLYSTLADLLGEYHRNNPHITVQQVDYVGDPGLAGKVDAEYRTFLGRRKDVVLFDCEGRVRVLPGSLLMGYDFVPEIDPSGKTVGYDKLPVAFKGEVMFTSMLMAVVNPKPLKAYFLTGHGEGRPDDADDGLNGFQKLAGVIQLSYAQVGTVSLAGTNGIPEDCNLLVIADPVDPLPKAELDLLGQYLNRGGRLLALFSFVQLQTGKPTGLEALLAKWGIEVTSDVIQESSRENSDVGNDIIVTRFGKHPVVDPFTTSRRIQMIQPRAVRQAKSSAQPASALHVDELAFSSPLSFSLGSPSRPQSFPLAAAMVANAIPGVVQQGVTRIVVTGDSIFLANRQIESAANRDFASYAVNWLLERNELLGGEGPKQMNQYRLLMTNSQLERARWTLLLGMPGSALLLGFLVWFRRRR